VVDQDFAPGGFERADALRAEAEEFADRRRRLLRERSEHRRDALLDQAVGVVMGRSGCGSAEAVAQLVAIARGSGRTLAAVAADVVAEFTGPGPEVVRARPEVAGLDRAADGDDLARGLIAEALGFAHPVGAAIGLLDDDGTVGIVGAQGFRVREIRRWRRIPPAMDCLINRALRADRPVWTDATASDPPPPFGEPPGAQRHQTRVAVPVRFGRALIGVVELAWPAPAELGDRARREVEAVVRSVGPSLLRTLGPEAAPAELVGGPACTASAVDSAWRDVLDLMDQPAFVVREDAGFQVIAHNRRAADLMTLSPTDNSLEAVAPWLIAADFLASVVHTGASWRQRVDTGPLGVTALTAVRVGPGAVLVVCHRASVEGTAADVAAIERLARFGTWRGDGDGARVTWSAEALRILDAPALGDSAGIHRPPYTVHPDDVETERRFIKTLTVEGRAAEAEFRILHYGGEPTRVRVAAEPVGGDSASSTAGAAGAPGGVGGDSAAGSDAATPGRAGAPGLPPAASRSLIGVIQDVTEWRRAETVLEVARVQLAAQRSRADAERQLASALQRAVVPSAARNQPPHSRVQIAARYRPASASAGVGGDWYSVFPLRGGKVLLAIGDVAGHGLPAASAMADLHHGLRGMALALAHDQMQTRPGRLLTLLNELVAGMPEFTIASACCLLWDPATRRLTWGNAGHPAPLRIRGDQVRPLEDRVGPMLGADPRAVYEDCEAEVASGDVLLLYTDGLVERRVGDDETAAHLLARTRDPEADLDRYADRVLADARSDTDDDVCVLAVRFE
jgi:serine phosphatase RsbU (regulator of sigma subunit)/PAS domain-containing protein